jgi:hypothetical protein
MRTKPLAQGWHLDPYGIHDDRHISQGEPANLLVSRVDQRRATQVGSLPWSDAAPPS